MKCVQDLCLNSWYDPKSYFGKIIEKLNPRVRCAFGNVYKYSTKSKNSQARVSKYYSVWFIRYLLTIHDHVYSCQYGTFIGNDIFGDWQKLLNIRLVAQHLGHIPPQTNIDTRKLSLGYIYNYLWRISSGNCQKEREELGLSSLTHSLWGYLTNSADEFVNPL